ncbi:MAG: alpha/beta fold hydrolase [Acidimicrobiales bacterium]
MRRAAAAGVALGAAVAAGTAGYAASRLMRWRTRGSVADADLVLPGNLRPKDVTMSDGGRLRVVEGGSGPAIVLVHGAGLTSDVWAYQFRDLSDRRRVLAIDQRGHGHSAAGSHGITIDAMADDLGELLEDLDLEKALLVGHSMGGMSVLRFARRHGDVLERRVGALLLVSTSGGVAPPGTASGRLVYGAGEVVESLGRRLARAGVPTPLTVAVGSIATRLGFGVSPSPAQVESTSSILRSMPGERLAGLAPELAAFDEQAPFPELGVPVTVLVGDRDRLTPPAWARRLAGSIPGARLVVWPGGGHMLMYERREAFDWMLEKLSEPRSEL